MKKKIKDEFIINLPVVVSLRSKWRKNTVDLCKWTATSTPTEVVVTLFDDDARPVAADPFCLFNC